LIVAEKRTGFSALGRAATGFLNLGVAGAAAVGAAALHSWPLVAVGGATYAALVAWDLVRGGDKRPPGSPEVRTLRDPGSYGDVQIQNTVRALLGAKLEIDRVLAETPDEVKGNLATALVSVDSLLERAAGLADRGEDLARYLLTKDPRVVRQDVDSLRQRVSATADAEAKGQYESALAAREEHLKALEDLRNAHERVLASMLSIASSLEGLPAKIVHMRALDADAMDKLGGDVKGELDRVNDEMKAFEETLRTLGEKNG
jgi:hypothetical protein